MVSDPRLARLRRRLEKRPATRLPRPWDGPEAAVAVVLRPRDELELLLIKRAEFEGDPWSGHVALPGGRRHAGDADLPATARRETAEETGIVLETQGVLLGELDEVEPRTTRLPPIAIAPFVYGTTADAVAIPDPREVAGVVWIPLPALRDETAASQILLERDGDTRILPSIEYDEYVIWGLTHWILMQFLTLAEEAGV